MKTKYALLLIIFASSITAFTFSAKKATAVSANDIVGVYWTADKEAKVKIFLASNGKYSGKTVWMKEPNNADGSPKTDLNLIRKTKGGKMELFMTLIMEKHTMAT